MFGKHYGKIIIMKKRMQRSMSLFWFPLCGNEFHLRCFDSCRATTCAAQTIKYKRLSALAQQYPPPATASFVRASEIPSLCVSTVVCVYV